MGSIHTFIVKIIWDQENPLALHGLLTCVATGEKFPFTDGQGLLELLNRLPGPEAVNASDLPPAQPDNSQSQTPKEAGK